MDEPKGKPSRGEARIATIWRPAVYAAAALSLLAEAVHLWVIPDHFAQWWGYGAFFAVVAMAQGFLGVGLLLWPRPPLFLFGILGNLVIVAFYVWTRTVGLPLGPHAMQVPRAGPLDLFTAIVELYLILLLATLWWAYSRGMAPSARRL